MSDGLADRVREALEPLGAVRVRPMFGGQGVYLDGLIVAILAYDELWLKSDAVADATWDAAGCERFTFDFGEGKTGTMNYRRAPSDCHDDPEALREWAGAALAASRRAAAKKRPKRG